MSAARDSNERDQVLWKEWQQGDREAAWRLLEHYDLAIRSAMHRLGITDSQEMEDTYQELVLVLAEYKDRNDLRIWIGLGVTY